MLAGKLAFNILFCDLYFIILIYSLIAILIFVLFGGYFYLSGRDVNIVMYSFFAISIPFIIFISVYGALLRGINQQWRAIVLEIVARPVLFFAFLLLSILLFAPIEKEWIGFWHFLSCLIVYSLIFFLFPSIRLLKTGKRGGKEISLDKAVPFAVLGSILILLKQIDIVMFGIFNVSSHEIGTYRVAVLIAAFLLIGNTIIAPIIEPRARQMVVVGERESLVQFLSQCGFYSLIAFFGVFAVLVGFGEVLIYYVFGEAFVASYIFLGFFAVCYFVDLFCGLTVVFLIAHGHQKSIAKYGMIAVVINIGLNAVLIPALGVFGGALATSFSWIAYKTMLAMVVRRRYGVWLVPRIRSSICRTYQ